MPKAVTLVFIYSRIPEIFLRKQKFIWNIALFRQAAKTAASPGRAPSRTHMSQTGKLLLVIEAGYGNLPTLFEGMGYEVAVETSARRGIAHLKNWQPDVVVADFYKRYFHDRVSNLESLLAAATRNPETRIIVLYDPFHAADLALLKQRHRIDAALPLPLTAAALQQALSAPT